MLVEAKAFMERRVEDVVERIGNLLSRQIFEGEAEGMRTLEDQQRSFIFGREKTSYSFHLNPDNKYASLNRYKGSPQATFSIGVSRGQEETITIIDDQSISRVDKTITTVKLRKLKKQWHIEKRTRIKAWEIQSFSDADIIKFLASAEGLVRNYKILSQSQPTS